MERSEYIKTLECICNKLCELASMIGEEAELQKLLQKKEEREKADQKVSPEVKTFYYGGRISK